jgi:hypothetical protein
MRGILQAAQRGAERARREGFLNAIASAEPAFLAIIEESERTLLRLLGEGRKPPDGERLAQEAAIQLGAVLKGEARAPAKFRGRTVLVSPGLGARLGAGEAIFRLQAALEATDAEPEFWS